MKVSFFILMLLSLFANSQTIVNDNDYISYIKKEGFYEVSEIETKQIFLNSLYDDKKEIFNAIYNDGIDLVKFIKNRSRFFDMKHLSLGMILDSEGQLSLNDKLIFLNSVNFKYIDGKDLALMTGNSTFIENYHAVFISCKTGENCIMNLRTEMSIAEIQPLETKEDCLEMIYILNQLKNKFQK